MLHNVDVAEKREPDAIRAALAQQAASPVRWVETIEAFAARGVTHVVECGPGRVLAGLNKRIVRELKSLRAHGWRRSRRRESGARGLIDEAGDTAWRTRRSTDRSRW